MSNQEELYILGVGNSFATTKITNQFLEDLDTGTNAEWILDKIGIETRVTTLPLEYIKATKNADPEEGLKHVEKTPTDFALEAIACAVERAGINTSQIGMIISDCCSPNTLLPTEAQRISQRLGISVPSFEVLTACPVFALHVDFIKNYKPEELPDYILCVTTTTMTPAVNYNDRTDGAIWADGAAAWIISPRKKGKLKVLDTFFDADPTRSNAVVVDRFGYFHQDGRAVRDFSVRQTVRLIKRSEEKFSLDWSKDIFIGHQANATMLSQIITNRDIPESSHWKNVVEVGNQAGGGAPASLAMNWDKITPSMKILVAVVGAGLSWGSVLLEGE